jgi:hypothetical protein
MSAPLTQVVALALWLGAAALLAAAVAPAAFAVLPSRALAGDVVGRVLPVVFWSGMLVGVVVAGLEWRSASPSRARLTSGALVALACAASHLYFGSRIARLRAEIGGPVDALAPGDPQRALFGRLHGLSVLGLGLAMLAAGVALALALRALRR